MSRYFSIFILLISSSWSLASPFENEINEESHLRSALAQYVDHEAEETKWVTSEAHHSQLMSHGFRTQKSILIMHGLLESPFYMQHFAEYFFDHGYNVYSLLLPGHQSQDREALSKVKYTEWITAAEQGFKIAQDLGDEVEILGYSTGGTLAAYLALERPAQIKKMYLISPALYLSFKISISSLLVGWSSLDSEKICKTADANNITCRALKFSDNQLEPMIKEGLISSLAAGLEVQKLISFISRKFHVSTASLSEENGTSNYYSNLMDIYLQIKVPILMVGTANDNVVNADFNNELARKYQGIKENIFFPKDLKVTHISITKTPEHGFQKAPEIYNPAFDQILNGLTKIMSAGPL